MEVAYEMFDVSQFHGDFCCNGKSPMPSPGLNIDGFGPVSLPINAATNQEITQLGIQSRNDPNATPASNFVEFDPSIISITNPMWTSALEVVIHSVAERLGLETTDFECRLTKVVLENEGVPFDRNRFLTAIPNSFGSIEIQFPSAFRNGAHLIRHQGLARTFSVGADDSSNIYETFFVSRFFDCAHEVEQISQGSRSTSRFPPHANSGRGGVVRFC